MKNERNPDDCLWVSSIGAVLILSFLITLSGCESEGTTQLKSNPQIVNIGTIEGCEVKYVNRGYKDNSFYIAKCNGTQTTTENYTERTGKNNTERTHTAITYEIQKLQKEAADIEMRNKALEKLTPSEKEALGIKQAS